MTSVTFFFGCLCIFFVTHISKKASKIVVVKTHQGFHSSYSHIQCLIANDSISVCILIFTLWGSLRNTDVKFSRNLHISTILLKRNLTNKPLEEIAMEWKYLSSYIIMIQKLMQNQLFNKGKIFSSHYSSHLCHPKMKVLSRLYLNL